MDIVEVLKNAVWENVSDVFIVAGGPISYRKKGIVTRAQDDKLMPDDTEAMVKQIYAISKRDQLRDLATVDDDDFSFAIPGLSRFRVNIYKQRGSYSAVIRVISFNMPDPVQLGLPESLVRIGDTAKGLVLVTGPAASGKTTTLTCMVDYINKTRCDHIITLEDPIEYLQRHDQSIVSQREIGIDTPDYVRGLREALRESPDVILLGELRDYETISIAMTAAETGHLLLSTLHTLGASNTVNRIIDVFPANQQHQIAVQLSTVLHAVISQQLLPTISGGMAPAFEVLFATTAVRNMIRDGKVYQLDGVIYSSQDQHMISMDSTILSLYKKGEITKETALNYAFHPETLERSL